MKVYLDVCCLNRPFDDQSQERIRLEAEAILLILSRLQAGEWQWLSSEVDVLLTTDDKLIRLASRFAERLHILVDNPLNWLVAQKEAKA